MGEGENLHLLVVIEPSGSEHILACYQKRLLAHRLSVVCQTSQNHAQKPPQTLSRRPLILCKPLLIAGIIFCQHSHCVQSHRNHPIVGIGHQAPQVG